MRSVPSESLHIDRVLFPALRLLLPNTLQFKFLFLAALIFPLCFTLPHANVTTLKDRAVSANYVFTTFTEASESNLYVYTSSDATTWSLLAGPTYTSPSGLIRDPNVMLHTDEKYCIACVSALQNRETVSDSPVPTDTTDWTGTNLAIAVSPWTG
jgi:hypothetical protein